MDRERRAHKGYTKEPYECCGKEAGLGGRPKRQICQECRNLISEGKTARELRLQSVERNELGTYNWTQQHYAWPGYYGPWDFPHGSGAKDELTHAMFDLVNLLAPDAPKGTQAVKAYQPRDRQGYESPIPWPPVIERDGHHEDRYDWKKLVIMRPEVRDAINRLNLAVRGALAAVYQEGKTRGGSILFGLASGETTMHDYEAAMLTPEERTELERKRRGY